MILTGKHVFDVNQNTGSKISNNPIIFSPTDQNYCLLNTKTLIQNET
jgi:hypothetical protein